MSLCGAGPISPCKIMGVDGCCIIYTECGWTQVPALAGTMEDLLLACILVSRRGPISLYENHECRFMKTFRLVEAMEDQLLTRVLLSQCGTGPILPIENLKC